MFSSLLPRPRHTPYVAAPALLLRTLIPVGQPLILTVPGNNGAQIRVSRNGVLTADQTPSPDAPPHQPSIDETIPLKKRIPHLKHHFPRYSLDLCPDDSLAECVRQTKSVLDSLLNSTPTQTELAIVNHVSSSLVANNQHPPQTRAIQIKQHILDPLIPSRFKLRKNRHRPPSPPPPVLKSDTATAAAANLTSQERALWKIPSAISNWKNNQGFIISLDKRVMAAQGGTQSEAPAVNTAKFSDLSLALSAADQQARIDIARRNKQKADEALHLRQESQQALRQLARDQKSKRPTSSSFDEPTKRPRNV